MAMARAAWGGAVPSFRMASSRWAFQSVTTSPCGPANPARGGGLRDAGGAAPGRGEVSRGAEGGALARPAGGARRQQTAPDRGAERVDGPAQVPVVEAADLQGPVLGAGGDAQSD